MECGYRVKEPRRICYDVVALSLSDTCAYGDLSSQALSLNGDSSDSYPGAPSSTVLHRFIAEKFFAVLNMGKAHSTAQWSAMLGGNFAMAMEAHQNPPDPGVAAPAGEPPGDSPAGVMAAGAGPAQAEELYSPTSPATPLGEEHSPVTSCQPG